MSPAATSAGPRVAVPARLSAGEGADPRIAAANRIFHDVVGLVRSAGLDPVIVDRVDMAGFEGLVLPGGGDVDPARYGGERIEALYDVNADQDALDFGIAEAALEAGVPILGICRGLQVLNAVYGGSLVEDLDPSATVHAHPADGPDWAWHDVELDGHSMLAETSGVTRMRIASGHHQGIRDVGSGLTVTAIAPDGLVEAFEDPDADLLAVQWHPEAEGADPLVRDAPFRAFAERVRARGDRRP